MKVEIENLATLEEHQNALYELLVEFDRVCCLLDIPYTLFAGTLLGAVRHQGFIPWDDDLDVMMLREDYDRFLCEAGEHLNEGRFFLQKEFSEHWPMFFSKLRLNGTTCLEKYHPKDEACHQGVYMDIFPCDAAASSALGRRLQFAASKVVIAKSLDARGYDTDSVAKRLFMGACRLLPLNPFLSLVKGGSEGSGYVHGFLAAASGFAKSVFPKRCFEGRTTLPFREGKYRAVERFDELLTILYGDYMTPPSEKERERKQHAILVDLENSYEAYEGFREGMLFGIKTESIR